MNPLTLVKRIQNLNSKEATLGISEEASWHAKYKDSAYVFVGGIPYDLTEGDLLAVFAQYGEIVDVNLVRDKGTGKSKGFAFIAYEDQRSTILAVDNLNGAQVLGRVIRVDHASNYKKKEEEDEETEQKKREERGVCRAFQRGECNRGAGCKFSHDEQRAANTGWGHQDDKVSKWNHDRFEGQTKSERRSGTSKDRDARSSRTVGREEGKESHNKPRELNSRYRDSRDGEKGSEQKEDTNHKEEWEKCAGEKKFRRHDHEPNSREAYDRREEKRSRRHDPNSYPREDRDTREQKKSSRHELESHRTEDRKRARDKWSDHDRDSSFDHHKQIDKESHPRSYR